MVNCRSAEHECDIQCKYDCLSHSYDIQYQVVDNDYDTNKITINRGDQLDTVVKHVPEVRFVEFFSNIGGLLGMWLGISLLQTFHIIDKAKTMLPFEMSKAIVN